MIKRAFHLLALLSVFTTVWSYRDLMAAPSPSSAFMRSHRLILSERFRQKEQDQWQRMRGGAAERQSQTIDFGLTVPVSLSTTSPQASLTPSAPQSTSPLRLENLVLDVFLFAGTHLETVYHNLRPSVVAWWKTRREPMSWGLFAGAILAVLLGS